MKKFLSMLLAVLMVVSVMVPMLTFLVGAEGADGDGAAENRSDIPELIITELCMNAYSNTEIYPYMDPETTMPKEVHYQQTVLAEGANATSYYEKTVDANGVVTFVKSTDTKAVAGKAYYHASDLNSSQTEIIEYFEVYNASDKPINLYDYKFVRDKDAARDGTTVDFIDMKEGAVEGTQYGNYFKYVGTGAGALANGFEAGVKYYTKNGATYTPVAAGSTPEAGVNYYVEQTGGYRFVNPAYEMGVLQPGQIAVVWNYNDNSWKTFSDEHTFKDFYSDRYSPKTDTNPHGAKDYYECDLWSDDVLVIAINSVTTRPSMGPNGGFWFDEWGQYNYGIAPDTVSSTNDNVRYEQWTSWVFWGSHQGYDPASLVKQEVTPGTTTVTGVKFVVLDSATGEYRSPSAADNTADENGKAMPGITYYKPDLSKSDTSALSNKVNGRTIHYLYGLDDTAPMKEGMAYTIYSGDLTPGILNNIQKFVLPNYGTGLNTETDVPDIVITEVVPDNVGDDQYEFIEVVNTSGRAINMFDYSLAANSSYCAYTNEYFNKINPIIPGNVGNILAAEPGSIYYNNAPTNMDYEAGWLQPGEVAVLWSYYSSAYAGGYTLDQFRNYFSLDEGTKLFAVDTDNTAYSGRGERQNLGNTGNYIYGLIPNKNINWYGDIWTSNPVFEPITYYESGKTHATATGFPLEACESFVMCAAPFVSCTNASPGEDYGYQFTYRTREGTPNRFGIYLDIARITIASTDYATFAFTGSVATTNEWKASPGILTPAQRTEITLRSSESRYVMYMQDFNGLGNVSGYDNVASLLGITGVTNNSILMEEHENNVALTESKGTPFLEVKDGRLYVNNKGKSDDYMLLMTDDVLNQVRNRDFTLEFAMSYAADSTNGKNGYSSVLYNFDGKTLSYGAPIIRVSGYGHNAVVRNGAMFNVEDASGANSMANTAVNGSSALTLYEKLKGNINSVGGFSNSLEGSVMMAGVDMVVRVEVSQTYGVTVSINGIVVSRTYDVAESATFADWSIFLEETVGNDLAMITTPDISVSYDYITLYTDTLGFNTKSIDASSLYITELNVGGGTQYYTQNAADKTNLGWIEFIEIANGGTEPVALKDYVILGTNKDGKLHYGNNIQWKGDQNDGDGNIANIYLDDWLGTDDYKANLTKGSSVSGNFGWYNPSENEAILQPGEVAVIFVVNGGNTFDQMHTDGTKHNFVEAACSWLKIDLNAGDAPLCIVTCSSKTTINDVEIDAHGAAVDKGNVRYGVGLAGYDTASCCYGIGRMNDKNGNRIDWKTVYTHDYRNLESMLDLNHSMAFGQDNTGTGSDIGKGGASLGNQGYSAHYVYGNDASSFYKIGTLWTRRNAPIMNWYDQGKTSVTSGKTGQYNVGKLYSYQIESFRAVQEMLAHGYQEGGGLVITEFSFDTMDSPDGTTGYDAYEAMEITNTSTTPINLYEYSLVMSGDATGGAANNWTSMTKLHPGCPIPKNHYAYGQLKDIANPEQVVVQPGESIVVWVYCWDTYKYVNEGAPIQTVEKFRQHWAGLGNDMINAKDENGEYKVKVVVATALDGAPNGNLSNSSIAKAYGISKNTDIYFNGSVRATSVVSYVVTASYAYHYDLRWTRHQITPSTHTGITTTGLFDWDPLLVEEVDFDTDTALSNLCVKNADGKYSFATAPYDQTQKHYRLYMYHNKQIFSGANQMANFAYNFIYGQTLAGNAWGVGGIMATVKTSSQTQPGNGIVYGITADAADWTPQVSTTIVSTGMRTNSYGYLLPEQEGMVAHLTFNYVGELEDGTRVYFHDSVAGEFDDGVVTNLASNVSVSGGQTTIAFSAAVGNDYYDKMVAHFGSENVTLGILSVRAADALAAGAIRPAYLEGYNYVLDDEYLFVNNMNGLVNFYGTAQPMDAGYYATTYSAVGFVRISNDAFGEITLYADTAANQSATQVLASAMFDYKTEQDVENGYIYEISAGKWSRFTAAQIARFEAICVTSQK